ncbi:hypothetical protein GCM10027290_57590 [Micromonospora sonneratiae]
MPRPTLGDDRGDPRDRGRVFRLQQSRVTRWLLGDVRRHASSRLCHKNLQSCAIPARFMLSLAGLRDGSQEKQAETSI